MPIRKLRTGQNHFVMGRTYHGSGDEVCSPHDDPAELSVARDDRIYACEPARSTRKVQSAPGRLRGPGPQRQTSVESSRGECAVRACSSPDFSLAMRCSRWHRVCKKYHTS